MSLLDTIKDQVARGISKSYADWKDYISDDPFGASDYAVNQVARRFARSVAEDALKRAAERATTKMDPNPNFYPGLGEAPMVRVVDKQSILSTPINTDL